MNKNDVNTNLIPVVEVILVFGFTADWFLSINAIYTYGIASVLWSLKHCIRNETTPFLSPSQPSLARFHVYLATKHIRNDDNIKQGQIIFVKDRNLTK